MGDIDEDDPEGIDLADCATLLGQPQLLLWIRSKIGKFASPAGTKNGRPFWHEDDVYRWAASTHPELIRRIPIRCWPATERPATYHGAQEIDDAVVQTWNTDSGTVCVVWARPGLTGLSLPRVAAQLPDADALIHVQSTFSVFEPELSTAQPDNLTEWSGFGATWTDLVRVLGQPAPYWPLMLRIPTLISAWKPGAPPATYPTIPEVDTTPFLRLAATLPQNSPAHEVLLHLARVAQQSSTISALGELRTLAECEQRSIDYGRHNGDVTVVAAHPLPIPKVDREAVSEQDRRGGWLEILARTDRLAAECVRQAKMWDGGRDFPFSNPEQINPNTEYGAEWSARLEPIERTAAFELIDPDGSRETLTDPETGAIVAREPNGLLLATIPQQLPTFGPLADVIFDRPIWVRTEDGRLYPAPKDSYWGLNWGYPGSGPGSLALLISRLLDNVTARGADNAAGAPAGLEELTQTRWPRGTVFTRAQLEAAHDGRPYTEE
ncbi:MAG: hypothetical protein ACRDRR_05455 [Pseudonocardiaceae bacterium]